MFEKGADVLLRAFAMAARAAPGARLLLAGDGPQRPELEVLARRLGIADRATFLGPVAREPLERRFEAAWVQVVPGRWEEPLGNVVLEAMMRGTALVASALGGPAEVVEDGRTGLLVAPGSAPALAGALSSLLADRSRCEELGTNGRATALAHYSGSRVVARFEHLYRELALARRVFT